MQNYDWESWSVCGIVLCFLAAGLCYLAEHERKAYELRWKRLLVSTIGNLEKPDIKLVTRFTGGALSQNDVRDTLTRMQRDGVIEWRKYKPSGRKEYPALTSKGWGIFLALYVEKRALEEKETKWRGSFKKHAR